MWNEDTISNQFAQSKQSADFKSKIEIAYFYCIMHYDGLKFLKLSCQFKLIVDKPTNLSEWEQKSDKSDSKKHGAWAELTHAFKDMLKSFCSGLKSGPMSTS